MPWVRTGSVNVTNGNKNVAGVGTDWLTAKVAPGDEITLPDGRGYEVETVPTGLLLTITTAYLGATAAAQAYVIKPIATAARLAALATSAATLVESFGDIAAAAGAGKFAAGAAVDGVFRPSVRGLQDDDTGWNWAGLNVLEAWQGNAKMATFAADGTPSGVWWQKAPISLAVLEALGGKASADAVTVALAAKASAQSVADLSGVVAGKAVPGTSGDQSPRNRQLGTAAYLDETVLYGSAAGPATAIAAAARPTVAIAVPGAEFGDFVQISLSVNAGGIEPTGYVSAAGTVTAVEPNPTASGITLGAHTIYARVTKRVPE